MITYIIISFYFDYIFWWTIDTFVFIQISTINITVALGVGERSETKPLQKEVVHSRLNVCLRLIPTPSLFTPSHNPLTWFVINQLLNTLISSIAQGLSYLFPYACSYLLSETFCITQFSLFTYCIIKLLFI